MSDKILLTFELTRVNDENGDTLGICITTGANLKPAEYAIALAYIRAIQPVTNEVLSTL